MLLRSGMVRAFRRGKAEWGKVVGTANRVCTKAVRVRGDAKRSDLLGDRRGGWCGELAAVRDTRASRSRVGQGPTGREALDMLKLPVTFASFRFECFFSAFPPSHGPAQPLVPRTRATVWDI